MTTLIDRLQSYMRHAAKERYDAVPVSPFTAFFHPFDAMVYFNYAIPDGPIAGDVSAPLKRLREEAGRIYERVEDSGS